MGVWNFFVSVWNSYLNDLSLAEQCLAALPFIAYFFGITATLKHYFKGKEKGISKQLEDEKNTSSQWLKKYNELEKEHTAISKTLPENWRQQVERERKDGNEEKAIGFLRDELKTLSVPLAKAADELASYHASVAYDLDGSHLNEAKRYCRISILHGGSSITRERFLDELDATGSLGATDNQTEFHDWSDLHSAFSVGQDSEAVIEQLNQSVENALFEGRYHIAEALVSRAITLVTRNNLFQQEIDFQTRSLKARVLNDLGRHADALAEIDAFLPLEAKVLSPEHPNVLSTYHLKAQVLNDLGRHADALAEIDAFLPLEAKVLSPEHPNVLSTYHLKAQVLNDLERHADALAEIDAFLPLEAKVLSPEHPNVLSTYHLKARVLNDLGRHADALAEIDALLPLQVKVRSAAHPYVFSTRNVKARVLSDLGRYEEALAEIDAFLPLQVKALPTAHPYVLSTRNIKTKVLNNLGRYEEALAEIDALSPLQAKVLPPEHPNVKTTKKLRAALIKKVNFQQ